MNKDRMKQSLLMGALASSFGIFVSKLLGLLYYSPLSAIAGEANMAFYSITYTYYDLLLQVSQAGIPFAIASLVAKYIAKDDYKTVLLVKKAGTSIIMGLTVGVALFFVLLAEPLARQSLGAFAPAEDIRYLRILFSILTLAVIIVPLLSSFRGYIQGLKRLDIYASSQVLEQFVRVFCIIAVGYLFVVVLHFSSIWAIFIAVAAAALGALIAYLFTVHMSREDERHVEELARQQNEDSGIVEKEIVKEILSLGIPYLIISFLGSAGPIVNTSFFMKYITKVHGMEIYESSKLAFGILQANVAKIANIPSVIAIGFGSGMVPYLAESLEKRELPRISKQISQILDTSMFILIPMIVIFVFFAKDIYFIMYGNNNLELGARLFAISNLQIFLGTIAPIFSAIMMSLKLRKEAIITLVISFLIKFLTFFPMVRYFYTYGMIYSSAFYYLVQIIMYYYFLHKEFRLNISGSLKTMMLITLASLIMAIPAFALHTIVPFEKLNRLTDIALMGGLGLLMLGIYYGIGVRFHLPQQIFETEDVSIRNLLSRLRR